MTRKTPGFLYKERALSVLTSLVERGLYFRDCLSRVIKENYQKEDASFSSSAINSLLDSGRPADIALVGEIFENKKDNPGFIWLCAVSMPGKLKKEGAFLIKPFIEAAEKITGFSQTPRIIESIKEAGPDGLPVLLEVKNWAKDYKKYENVAALALGEMGPAAIPFLREIALNSNREAKAQALVSLIKLLPDSWTVIEEISQVGDPDLSRPALRFLKGTRKNLSLGRKPLFATLFQEELEWRLGYLNEITEQLRAEFPTDFIGISVFGSHSRGHVKPGSDLDFMLLARDRKVYERFHEVVKLVIPLCVENCYFAEINGDNRLKEKKYGFGALYYGLFFGDLEALTEIQNNSMFSQKDYDNYRAYVLDKESYFSKSYAIKQTPQGNNKVKYHAWLTRVPPPYEETKKLLEKRIRRTKVKK